MKKALLLISFVLLLAYTHIAAQCTVTVTPAIDTLCIGDSTTLTATVPSGGSLLTTMAGGNNHRGNMFDLTAINTVTITQFDGNPVSTTNIAIYYRVGTHVGFETSSVGWTLIGTANNVVPLGSPTPTPFPIPVNITIPGGQTYAFYVTSTNTAVSLNYTNGTTVGNVFASDANLQFREGKGMEYPFCNGGTPFSPRNWNGRIHYTVPTVASYAWSNGATTNSITVAPTSTTTYSVTATAGATCTSSAVVNVGAPNVNLGPDSAYCQGGSITLNAGTANSYLWSNGATTQSITGSPGLNWAQVTDAFGCTDRDSVQLTANPLPTVNIGPDTLLCGQPSYTLDAGNPGATYAWSNGDSTQTTTITAPGSYSVSLADTNGCTGTDTATVLISQLTIDLGPDTTLCNAASTIFSVGNGWASILWSNGSTNSFINVNATNDYSVFVQDSVGCTATDTVSVLATTAPIASFTITGASNCTQATVANNSQNDIDALWIWGDGNTSTGLNPGPHTYAQPYFGDITLVVMNPCGSDTLTQPFGCVGNAAPQGLQCAVAPNPTHGRFQLSVEGTGDQQVTIRVTTLQGQVVLEEQHQLQGALLKREIDLQNAAAGTYLIRIDSESGHWAKRLVVAH